MSDKSICLIFSGDFAPLTNSYSLVDGYFDEIHFLLVNSDLHITNLECPITSSENKIDKSGPHIKTAPENIKLLKDAFVSIACLANNHIFDFGEKGINDTITVCQNSSVETVGIVNRTDHKPSYLIKELKGKKIGFLNYCEHEFSVREPGQLGANGYDPVKAFYDITELKSVTDYIIVIYHGGNEYYNLPSPELKKTFHYLADLGADAVIGHHTHVFSGYEIYNGKPLVYSLGNFFFPLENEPESWFYGLLLKLTLNEMINLEFFPVEQCRYKPEVRILPNGQKQDILDKICELSTIIADYVLLEQHWHAFVKRQSLGMIKSLPCMTLFHRALIKFGIPFNLIISKKRLLAFQNIIHCEAHTNIFKRVIKKIQ